MRETGNPGANNHTPLANGYAPPAPDGTPARAEAKLETSRAISRPTPALEPAIAAVRLLS